MQRVVSAFNNPMGEKVVLRAGIDAGPCAGFLQPSERDQIVTWVALALSRIRRLMVQIQAILKIFAARESQRGALRRFCSLSAGYCLYPPNYLQRFQRGRSACAG
jgi:hypothetical protein